MQTNFFRRFFPAGLLLSVLILMLIQAPCVIQGAHAGLELWYEAVLPSILPFMIITSLLLQQSGGRSVCFLGLLCGLPIGANLVNLQYQQRLWTRRQADRLLCICNITSPMFMIGYILHHTLRNEIAVLPFLLSVYLPSLLYFLMFLFFSGPKESDSDSAGPISADPVSSKDRLSLDRILSQSLNAILTIGLIIMLFCIGMQFLLKVIPASSVPCRILVSVLEITNGIHLIMELPVSLQQKTALIAGLTSFGGICSILQTKHVITSHELSVLRYSIVKLCMGLFSYLLVHLFYMIRLFPK